MYVLGGRWLTLLSPSLAARARHFYTMFWEAEMLSQPLDPFHGASRKEKNTEIANKMPTAGCAGSLQGCAEDAQVRVQ